MAALRASVSSVTPSPTAPKPRTLKHGSGVEVIGKASNNLERVPVWQGGRRRGRERLIPKSHRRDIVAQRQETMLAAPTEGLAGDADVFGEAHGVGEVPTVHAETHL